MTVEVGSQRADTNDGLPNKRGVTSHVLFVEREQERVEGVHHIDLLEAVEHFSGYKS